MRLRGGQHPDDAGDVVGHRLGAAPHVAPISARRWHGRRASGHLFWLEEETETNWRFNLIGFIAEVVWPAVVAVAKAPGCNDNGVPDDVDLAGKMYWTTSGAAKIQRADLDICIEGGDGGENVSIDQSKCENQVDWSCA